ncbi:MAG TPA: type I-B CRISPR-associated protein Cas8b1/Cst1 [Syntrophomonadaceae bacterium]|nr:type I-B CRISPR-associated protein Cas8b1/Cst1 [Syntrophomonadaceae bacterium]
MDDLEIYPADWYFNACVQGFLEVLEWGLGKETIESFLRDDGSAVIPGDLAEAVFSSAERPLPPGYPSRDEPADGIKRIVSWWAGKTFSLQPETSVEEQLGDYPQELLADLLEVYVGGKGEGKLAEEFIKSTGIAKKVAASLVKALLASAARGELPGVSPDLAAKVRLTVAARKRLRKGGDYENLATSDSYETLKGVLEKWFALEEEGGDLTCAFCGKRFSLDPGDQHPRVYEFYFLRTVSSDLGSSPNKLPNFFWNGEPSLPMCRLCRSYLLCSHIVRSYGFFLNTGSFKANWYLNRLLRAESSSSLTGSHGFYNLLDALAASSRLRKLLGGWTLTGLEVMSLRKGKVEYHFISATVARWLLNTRTSALLRSFSSREEVEERIWGLLLAERIEDFLDIAYTSLYSLMGGRQGVEVGVLADSGKVVDLLKLYAEIKRQGGESVRYLNMDRLREEGRRGPLNTEENSKKNLVFRILELARLGRRDDVYHILLRTYVANGQIFPEELSRVFEVKDDSLFRTGVFAYIAGVTAGGASDQSGE